MLYQLNNPSVAVAVEPWFRRIADTILRFAAALAPDIVETRRTAAFSRLMTQHDDMISRICLSYSRTRAEYEDLRQDCYVALWQGLERDRKSVV